MFASILLYRKTHLFIAFGILVGVVWWFVDKHRGEKHWADYVASAKARGTKLTAPEVFAHEPVADEVNFASSPMWKKAFTPGEDPTKIIPELPKTPKDQAAARTRRAIDLEELRNNMLREKWIPEADRDRSDSEAILDALKRFQPYFDELRTLRVRTKSHFPVQWVQGFSVEYPHLYVAKNLNAALATKAHAEIKAGLPDSAFEDLKDIFMLASALDSSPGLIPALLSFSIEFIAMSQIQEGMTIWNVDQLRGFEGILARRNPIARHCVALAGERAVFNSAFEPLATERDIGRLLSIDYSEPADVSLLAWLTARRMRWWRENQLWTNQAYDEEIACFDPSAEMWLQPSVRSFDIRNISKKDPDRHAIAPLVLAGFSIFHRKAAYFHALTRMGQLACALELFKHAHGSYPAQLEELKPAFLANLPIDPCSGEAFRYHRLNEKNYRLYSVGEDRVDHGGEGDAFDRSHEVSEMRDWVWLAPSR